MKKTEKVKGYRSVPFTFNRKMVEASASVTRRKNTIHCITEIDISKPRKLIREHFEKTGEKLSLTAYVVTCLSRIVAKYPELNSFRKGNRLILLDDVTISTLIERELDGEKVPEPIGIARAQVKTYREIHQEIRKAQIAQNNRLGGLSGMTWIRFIPGFLLRTFVRIADRNITLGKRYGKVSVTAAGMYGSDAVWFIPHGTTTVLITIGSIIERPVKRNEEISIREHLCLTASFDHDIIDGAPAARFMKEFTEMIKSGDLLKNQE